MGEFEKRIKGIPIYWYYPLLDLIEECRREFPRVKQSVRVSGDGKEYLYEYYDAIEIKNWVVKWFGEATTSD
jgi:hypothetical protein